MQQIVNWLKCLINFNTTMDEGDTAACAAFIADTLRDAGIQADIYRTYCIPGKQADEEQGPKAAHHVYALIPGQCRKTILLHAHMDTAPYERGLPWRFPPDQATEHRGCICGRGALDCKGQVAVWMRLMTDAAASALKTAEPGGEASPFPYTLALLVTDREELGGEDGLGALMCDHPELFEDIRLVIGEGGGFPFSYRDSLYYTFQTGEREPEKRGNIPESEDSGKKAACTEERKTAGPEDSYRDHVLQLGVDKGYYAPIIIDYCRDQRSMTGRRLDTKPLYEGMKEWFEKVPASDVYADYGDIFRKALQSEILRAELMPFITPGFSDNRWFRLYGIPVIGFFPLDLRNALSGIHGKDEYVSERSLELAYRVMSGIIMEIMHADINFTFKNP